MCQPLYGTGCMRMNLYTHCGDQTHKCTTRWAPVISVPLAVQIGSFRPRWWEGKVKFPSKMAQEIYWQSWSWDQSPKNKQTNQQNTGSAEKNHPKSGTDYRQSWGSPGQCSESSLFEWRWLILNNFLPPDLMLWSNPLIPSVDRSWWFASTQQDKARTMGYHFWAQEGVHPLSYAFFFPLSSLSLAEL